MPVAMNADIYADMHFTVCISFLANFFIFCEISEVFEPECALQCFNIGLGRW